MNKEYIERGALIQTIEHNPKLPVSRIIREIKAADVVPVIHGEWKNHTTYVECSVCGAMPYSRSIFCPNCGADMRGVHKDA